MDSANSRNNNVFPDNVLLKIAKQVSSPSTVINLSRTSHLFFKHFTSTGELAVALECLHALFKHAALGEWKEIEDVWKIDTGLLSCRGTVFFPNRTYDDNGQVLSHIPAEQHPGRYQYAGLTLVQMAMKNGEWRVAGEMATYMDGEKIQNQFKEIFPDGKIKCYRLDLEGAKVLLQAVYVAVTNDSAIREDKLHKMNQTTKKALYALYDYVKPAEEHKIGLVFDEDIYAEALRLYEENQYEWYRTKGGTLSRPLFSQSKVLFWSVRVEEYLASLLGTGQLRYHAHGLYSQGTISDCNLANGDSIHPFRRQPGSIPGAHFFVDAIGMAQVKQKGQRDYRALTMFQYLCSEKKKDETEFFQQYLSEVNDWKKCDSLAPRLDLENAQALLAAVSAEVQLNNQALDDIELNKAKNDSDKNKNKINLFEQLPKELANRVCEKFEIENGDPKTCDDTIRKKVTAHWLKFAWGNNGNAIELIEEAIEWGYLPWLWSRFSQPELHIDGRLHDTILKKLKNNNSSDRKWLLQQLCGADLNDLNLSAFDLEGANLAYANLAYATIPNLSYANLTGARLPSFLKKVDLSCANLTNADLSDCTLEEVNMKKAILAGARLNRSTFTNCDLSETNLEKAQVHKAVFSGVNFTLANLAEIIFYPDGYFGGHFAHYSPVKQLCSAETLLCAAKIDVDKILVKTNYDHDKFIKISAKEIEKLKNKILSDTLKFIQESSDIEMILAIPVNLSTSDNHFLASKHPEIKDAVKNKLISFIEMNTNKAIKVFDTIIRTQEKIINNDDVNDLFESGINHLLQLIAKEPKFETIKGRVICLMSNRFIIPRLLPVIMAGRGKLLDLIKNNNNIHEITKILADLSAEHSSHSALFSGTKEAGTSQLLGLIECSKEIAEITDMLLTLSSSTLLTITFSEVIKAGTSKWSDIIKDSYKIDIIIEVLNKLVNKSFPNSGLENIINVGRQRLLDIINGKHDSFENVKIIINILYGLINNNSLRFVSGDIINSGKKQLLALLAHYPSQCFWKEDKNKLRYIANTDMPRNQENESLSLFSSVYSIWRQPSNVDEQLKQVVEEKFNQSSEIKPSSWR